MVHHDGQYCHIFCASSCDGWQPTQPANPTFLGLQGMDCSWRMQMLLQNWLLCFTNRWRLLRQSRQIFCSPANALSFWRLIYILWTKPLAACQHSRCLKQPSKRKVGFNENCIIGAMTCNFNAACSGTGKRHRQIAKNPGKCRRCCTA